MSASSENTASGIVLSVLGGASGISAVAFQWADSRWPTAQAKLWHFVLTGVSTTFDVALAILVLVEDPSKIVATPTLLTTLTSLFLAVNSIRLFTKEIASDVEGQRLTWSHYTHLACNHIPGWGCVGRPCLVM